MPGESGRMEFMMSEEKEQAPLLDGASVERVFEALSGVVEPHCELNHGTALELLVAVVLAQLPEREKKAPQQA